MGLSKGGVAGKNANSQGEPIDLDMTPMMNMLIILISFLVTMVVFTQLSVIQFNLPTSQGGAGGADSAATPGEETDITLLISETGFQVVGEGRKYEPMPKRGKGYDYQGLAAVMKQLKAEYPAAQSVVMLIDTSILYQDIVTAMDVCRENKFPNILLSGGVYQ